MAFVVAFYYTGFSSRYDGSGNTDTATIRLFSSVDVAIEAAHRFILCHIEQQIFDGVREDPKFDDYENMKRKLEESGTYNFEDTYMITMEHRNIETILKPIIPGNSDDEIESEEL
jgi:hypothetical protein